MKEKVKKSQLDDYKLVRRAMQSSHDELSQLEDPEVAKKREASILENRANEMMTRFNTGYEVILKEILEHSVGETFSAKEESDPVLVDNCMMKDEIKELMGDLKTWKEQLIEQRKLQALCGYSNNVLLNFYEMATRFFDEKKYDDALNAFTFLCMLNPAVSSFWIGQALTFEAKQDYTKAIEAFEKGVKAEPLDFDPFLGMIRCSQELKDYHKVRDLLEAERENPAIEEEVKEALEYIKSLQK